MLGVLVVSLVVIRRGRGRGRRRLARLREIFSFRLRSGVFSQIWPRAGGNEVREDCIYKLSLRWPVWLVLWCSLSGLVDSRGVLVRRLSLVSRMLELGWGSGVLFLRSTSVPDLDYEALV